MKATQHSGRHGVQTIDQSLLSWKDVSPTDWQDWRWQLRHGLRGVEGLLSLRRALGITDDSAVMTALVDRYRFQVVPYYISLMDPSDPNDPIRRQCIPDVKELADVSAGNVDPFGELAVPELPGVVHRFPDRVLLLATTDCAVYCRHCTRKNTLDGKLSAGASVSDAAIAYIAGQPQVREVLISGGDPLVLDVARLDRLLERVCAIPHVEVVRIGTRVPVVLPMRVDTELVDMLRSHRPLWVNTQFNHPRELTPEAITACMRLTDGGIPVSNQSVLLKGINDDDEVMRELCAALQRNLIRPYYVFQCDPIPGISHFRTPEGVGGAMERTLRASLGGLCLPRFVADIPSESGKVPLN